MEGLNMVKFGVVLYQEDFEYPMIKKITLESERLGFDSIWFHDHLSTKPILECWTLLSALSSETSKLRLGPLVLGNSYRSPTLISKMAATLDNISNGRLEFGIGAGWQHKEYLAYGYPFPKASIRINQLDESLQIIKKMWTEKETSFKGRYFSLNKAICLPKPIQKPHPPIWVGGKGNSLLNVVAKHADGCNFNYVSPDKYKERLIVLKEYCRLLGRDFDCIKKSLFTDIHIEKNRDYARLLAHKQATSKPKSLVYRLIRSGRILAPYTIMGNPDDCIQQLQKYIDLDVTHFMLRFPKKNIIKSLRFFSENIIFQI
jgi:alkanesulfonate monooxygenase SsuD/methylene tetrahydromethanopterin reductase-like flavin-dependent oxidoreductase (luciferase family)